MQRLNQPQRHESEFKQLLYMPALILILYLFYITWPASLALSLVLAVWWLTKEGKSSIARETHKAALPMLIGIGSFWIVSLIVALLPKMSDSWAERLSAAEQTLLSARRTVHALTGPNLIVYLLLLAILLIVLVFFPKSRAISQLIETKKQLGRLHLCLLAMTTFTFFGGHATDELAREDHENRLKELAISLRTESESAKKLLAEKVAKDSVSEVLKTAVAQQNKARLAYLIKSFQNPVYVNVPSLTDRRKRGLIDLTGRRPQNHSAALFADTSERIQIDRSLVMMTFIDDFSKELRAQVELPQSTGSEEAVLENVARQELGPVPESPEEWQRQVKLIQEEKALASQSEGFYKEASAGITEGLTAMFSEGLGFLVPSDSAKEWIIDIKEALIDPLFERKTEQHVEPALKWFRNSLSASRIQDVPEELKQEIQPASSVVSEALFPSFLKGSGTAPESWESKEIPEEVAQEIVRREENTRKEIEQREIQARQKKTPTSEDRERNRRVKQAEELRKRGESLERERTREREVRERPKAP